MSIIYLIKMTQLNVNYCTYSHVKGVDMVILESRPVGGYLVSDVLGIYDERTLYFLFYYY